MFLRLFTLFSMPRYDEDDENGQHHQLVTLLRINMGQIKYPTTNKIRKHDIFRSREDLLTFEQCQDLYTGMKERLEAQEWEEALEFQPEVDEMYDAMIADEDLVRHECSLPRFLRRYTCLSLLVYLKTRQVEALQRLRKYSEAIKVLRFLLRQKIHYQDYRGEWYDRLALNLDQHLKMHAEALEVVETALNDPEVRVGFRLMISNRGQKLISQMKRMVEKQKRKRSSDEDTEAKIDLPELNCVSFKEAPKVIIEGRAFTMDNGPGTGFKRIFIRGDSACHSGEGDVVACSVEELALGHYKEEGYTEGLHAEGAVSNSIFGLLFWDIIYCSPVPDAFRLINQGVPLDLDYRHFYESRKEDLDRRLDQVANMTDDGVQTEIVRVFEEFQDEASIVKWDLFKSSQHAIGLILSLGVSLVAKICERLAKDHRFTRSGYPDLTVWNPEKRICRTVEVKGPNDRLSTKQMLWLDYLMEWGAVAEVCHVEAIGAKRMKSPTKKAISNLSKANSPVNLSEASPPQGGGKKRRRKPRKKNLSDSDSDNDFEVKRNVKRKKLDG